MGASIEKESLANPAARDPCPATERRVVAPLRFHWNRGPVVHRHPLP